MKNKLILKMIKKKFGIKTTMAGLATQISARKLRDKKQHAAAESSEDVDDEEELQKLPPEDY